MKAIILGIILFVISGCGFLDIETPGIVNSDKMFENEQGYIDAMAGIYASMTRSNLYGESLSFGLVDELAQLYYNDYEGYETIQNKIYNLDYLDVDVSNKIDLVWNNAYNVISSANSILDNIPGKDFNILPQIEAEALTVRAFIHFDMLRLFSANYDKPDALAIPYADKFSIIPFKRLTVKEVYTHIISDLNRAYLLLNKADKTPRSSNNLYISNAASAAILARVYNWAGDHINAEKFALEALKGGHSMVQPEQVKTLFMGYIARTECIWGLHAPKMYLNVRRKLVPTILNENFNMIRDNYKDIYNVSSYTSSSNDYRYQAYFSVKWGRPICEKLFDSYYDEEQIVATGRTPGINLIRLSEIYYILAESTYSKDKNIALSYLNKVINARGLDGLTLSDIDTEEKFQEELINEYVKEYWAEGQIFFTYKRFWIDMKGLDGKLHRASDDIYILPLPQAEISGGKN